MNNLSMKLQPLCCCTGTPNHCCSSEECGMKGEKVGEINLLQKSSGSGPQQLSPKSISLPPNFLDPFLSNVFLFLGAPHPFLLLFSSLLDVQAVCVRRGGGAYGYTCVKVDGLRSFPCVSMCVCVYAL